jgi:hypothetical protein
MFVPATAHRLRHVLTAEQTLFLAGEGDEGVGIPACHLQA